MPQNHPRTAHLLCSCRAAVCLRCPVSSSCLRTAHSHTFAAAVCGLPQSRCIFAHCKSNSVVKTTEFGNETAEIPCPRARPAVRCCASPYRTSLRATAFVYFPFRAAHTALLQTCRALRAAHASPYRRALRCPPPLTSADRIPFVPARQKNEKRGRSCKSSARAGEA